MARVTRRFVPEIVVFLALGVFVGPDGPLTLINDQNIVQLRLVTVVALGMIIFLLGDRLRVDDVRSRFAVLLPLNVAQIALTATVVYLATTALGAPPRLAFVLAVIAAETGVLTVTATVREVRADGEFTKTLLTSVGVTNVVVAALFGITFPFVLATGSQAAGVEGMALAFVQIVVASPVIGLVGGWVLTRFGVTVETSGELLLFVVVALTGVAGSILAVNGSVVLGTLVAGIYVANRAPWLADRLFAAVRTLEAPIYLVFFVIAGAGIHLDELRTVGVLGAAYAVARTVGKVAGAMLGGRVAHPSLPHGHALPLGLGLLPHAGMAIALVAFVVEQTPALGAEVSGAVLGSIVIFELAGPLLLRRVLHTTGDAGGRNAAAAVDEVDGLGVEHRVDKIVIPVGNIGVALPRLPFLFSLVARLDAELVVVHVSRPGTTERHRDVPDVLTLIQRLAGERDVRCTVRHRVSEHVASAIADTVREEAADLLIMGEPISPSMLQAARWGRTVQRVTGLVDVPILVYPVDPDDPGDPGEVPAAYRKRAARIRD